GAEDRCAANVVQDVLERVLALLVELVLELVGRLGMVSSEQHLEVAVVDGGVLVTAWVDEAPVLVSAVAVLVTELLVATPKGASLFAVGERVEERAVPVVLEQLRQLVGVSDLFGEVEQPQVLLERLRPCGHALG